MRRRDRDFLDERLSRAALRARPGRGSTSSRTSSPTSIRPDRRSRSPRRPIASGYPASSTRLGSQPPIARTGTRQCRSCPRLTSTAISRRSVAGRTRRCASSSTVVLRAPATRSGSGLASLAELKYRYGDRVEIVCAGESWNPGQFGYGDVAEQLGPTAQPRGGRRPLPDLPHRSGADADEAPELPAVRVHGLRRRVRVQPQSRTPPGSSATSENCLLADPLPGTIADRIGALVDDPALRERIVETALDEVSSVRWDDQIERIWRAITKQDDGFSRPGARSRRGQTSPAG